MEDCLQWMYAQKDRVETGSYGWSREMVEESLNKQKEIAKEIDEYADDLAKVTAKVSESDKEACEELYANLKQTSHNKIHCLENLWSITAMQGYCVEFSRKFDARAVQLVKDRAIQPIVPDSNATGFVTLSSQDCVFATRDSWDWLTRLVGCIDVHLRNAAEYHEFFHEVDEMGCWMRDDIRKLFYAFNTTEFHGSHASGENMYEKLTEFVTAFRQWQAKTLYMWQRAMKLYPLRARTETLENPAPARIITDYKGPTYSVRSEEDVLLLDNSDAQLWKVRNARSEEGVIPAACMVIPGPDKEAMEAAGRLRMQLLAAWTNAMKQIGKKLLVFLLHVFKADYDDDEIRTMRSISMMDRQDLLRALNYIDDTMKVHWKDHEGFQNLQERLLMLRMILESMEREPVRDEEAYKAVVVQINTLEKLLKEYDGMGQNWANYKTALETSQAPELMLMLDKWEQLKFVSPEQMSKLWVNELPFDDHERSLTNTEHMGLDTARVSEVSDDEDHLHMNGTIRQEVAAAGLESIAEGARKVSFARTSSTNEEGFVEEGTGDLRYGFEETTTKGVTEGSAFGYATETKTAKTEQLSQAEVEESRKFVIKYVVDPVTSENISLDEAVLKGIIRSEEGVYCKTNTGELLPIPAAMNEGLIKVSFSTVKRGKEKKTSIGIITVQTERTPVRPYKALSVKDTAVDEDISAEEAAKRRILAEDLGLFKCSKTGKEYHIPEAAEAGLVKVEYTGPQPEPEIIRQSYAVRAAVDRKNKKVISFQDAVQRGMIDKESGAFLDTASGNTMYIGDAIMKGYLKARKIDNPTKLDISPENQMFINNTDKFRKGSLIPQDL